MTDQAPTGDASASRSTNGAHKSVHARPDLSVVIPAFNEGQRIERALAEIVQYLRGRGDSFEIVVADDGSSDGTADVVERFAATQPLGAVRSVRLPFNQGKGAALRAGFAATVGNKILMTDADLATPIEELGKLEAAFAAGAQIVAGSRALASSNITRRQSLVRVFLGRAGNLWIRSLAVPGIHDTQCGFKLFDGDAGRRLFALSREDRFGIDIEVLCLARRRLSLKVSEVGVRWQHQDGSKVRWVDYVDVLVKVPRIVLSVLTRGT